jgi:hypothetical protein
MSKATKLGVRRTEAGIALLISIFILLLISVVAIALIVSAGTESALAGNYRSSTGVYYAALAGVEEVRSRLGTKSPDSFKNTDPGFLPPPGTPLAVCSVHYVLNSLGTESVTPWVAGSTYTDNEYGTEFASSSCTMPSSPPTASSMWNRSPLNTLPFPGPLYKWVRINAVSEQSLNLDVSPYDGSKSSTTPIYYDGANLNDRNIGNQVLEITALAVLPNGSQKLVQYLTAPVPINLTFNAALTLDGYDVQFSAPTSSNFWVRGDDNYSVGSCNPGPSTVAAVGYTSNSPDPSQNNILSGIPSGPPPFGNPDRRNHYTNGNPMLNPYVSLIGVQTNMQTVGGLNSLVQDISQAADTIISPLPVDPTTGLGTATFNDLPAAMSYSNPMTIVVNGNLSLAGWQANTGYGLLLVTGDFTWDPDSTWKGIVLVIGTGRMTSSHGTDGEIDGAVFLAKTVNTSVSPYAALPPSSPPGSASFVPLTDQNPAGIRYSTCWIKAAMPMANYKILAFHEIAQ